MKNTWNLSRKNWGEKFYKYLLSIDTTILKYNYQILQFDQFDQFDNDNHIIIGTDSDIIPLFHARRGDK
jgi:hypothetical protein